MLAAFGFVVAVAAVATFVGPWRWRESHANTKVVLDHLEFEITGVHTTERGRDVVVGVAVAYRNLGEGPVTAFTSDSGFLGGNGKTYGLRSGGTSISNLPRGAAGKGTFVYEVDRGAVRGGRLLLTDCAAPLLDLPDQRCAVATIDLGLG